MLYALASRANEKGECWPSIATLCRDTGLAKRTVQLHLRQLVDQQLVVRKERRGRATLFRLTLDARCAGARDAPVHATTEGGACDASDPRTACVKPPQGVHPKLKGKEQRRLASDIGRDTSPIAEFSTTRDRASEPKWWESNGGVDSKGRQLGLTPRPGESYAAFKDRVFSVCKLRVAK